MKVILSCAIACSLFFCGCASRKQHAAGEYEGPLKYKPWEKVPALKLEDATVKVMKFLSEKKVNFDKSYYLGINRFKDESWWFNFRSLPLSPAGDFDIIISDTGEIRALPGL